jgi:hypothetical protein
MTDPEHRCDFPFDFPFGFAAANLPDGIIECLDCHEKYKIINVRAQR